MAEEKSEGSNGLPHAERVCPTPEAALQEKALPETKIYAILDAEGNCIKFAESMELAKAVIIQRRFDEALTSLYGPDAIERYKQAVVMPVDALKKVFGPDAIGRVESKANSIPFTIETMSIDDIARAAREIAKPPIPKIEIAAPKNRTADEERKS
jgi:hypothetical protein